MSASRFPERANFAFNSARLATATHVFSAADSPGFQAGTRSASIEVSPPFFPELNAQAAEKIV
jgi:hypothetical protein